MGFANDSESLEVVSVAIGRWASGPAPLQIRTLLGSCVGVVLYDRNTRFGGVLHIVLPDSRGVRDHPGRFADTGIPALIADMEKGVGRSLKGRLTAKLAGGAKMFQAGSAMNIGKMNLEAAESILAGLNIAVIARDVGGEAGRHLTLDTRSGIVTVRVPGGADYTI